MANESAHIWAQRLCIAAKTGDKKAMSDLVDRCSAYLFSKVDFPQLDDDDVKQTCRIAIWRAVLKYESGRGASFWSYITFYAYRHVMRALGTQSISFTRFLAFQQDEGLLALELSRLIGDSCYDGLYKAHRRAVVSSAVRGLSVRQQDVLEKTLDGYTQAEVAEALGVSHTTVQNDLTAIVRYMRRYFGVGAAPPKVRDRSEMQRWRAVNKDKENARRRELYAAKKAQAT